MLVIIITMAISGFYGCTGGEDKKAEEVSAKERGDTSKKKQILITDNCTGISNLVIADTIAWKMMRRYDSIYKKKGTPQHLPNLSNAIWIDEMIIRSYAVFFFDRPAGASYDGVRFVNAATNNNTPSRLLMVPTQHSTTEQGKHVDIWGRNIIPLLGPETPEYLDFETSLSTAVTLKDNFTNIYRTTRSLPRDKDPLSEGIWFSRCVFSYLRLLIENTSHQIDGIRIYMGAYDYKDPNRPSQIDSNQSTLILVPTTEGTSPGEHNDRWDIIKTNILFKADGALNHGELCPRNCPPDGGGLKKNK